MPWPDCAPCHSLPDGCGGNRPPSGQPNVPANSRQSGLQVPLAASSPRYLALTNIRRRSQSLPAATEDRHRPPSTPNRARTIALPCPYRPFRCCIVIPSVDLGLGICTPSPVDQAALLGLKANDFKADYAGDLRPIRELVLPMLDKGEREYVEQLYDDYLDDPGNFDYEPTVMHCDLSPEHIIYDPVTQAIAGVIDFGDMEIGDPDYEMHWLYGSYGDGFLQTYLAFNPHPSPGRLLRKLRFFHRANTVGDILMGFHRDDPETVEDGIAALKLQAEADAS